MADLGQLWITLGVNTAALQNAIVSMNNFSNSSTAAMNRLAGATAVAMSKVDSATAKSALTLTKLVAAQQAVADASTKSAAAQLAAHNRLIDAEQRHAVSIANLATQQTIVAQKLIQEKAAQIAATEKAALAAEKAAARQVTADARAAVAAESSAAKIVASNATIAASAEKAAAKQVVSEARAAAAAEAAAAKIVASNAKIALAAEKAAAKQVAADARAAAAAEAAAAKIAASNAKIAASAEKAAEKQVASEARAAAAAEAAAAKIAAAAEISAVRVNKAINSAALAFTRFGYAMSLYTTVPFLLIGAAAIKTTTEVDKVRQKILAFTGTTAEQMASYDTAITRIANTTHQSVKALTESLYFIATPSIDAATTLQILEASAKGAAAGMGSAEEIGKTLVFSYGAFGKAAFDTSKYMDAVAVSVREGVLEVKDIVPVLGSLMPIASQLGLKFNEVTASVGAMTKVGLNAATSATYVRNVLFSLLKMKPGSAASESLEMLSKKFNDASISVSGFKNMLKEDGGLVKFLLKLDELRSKTGGELYSKLFPNIRATLGVMSLAGKNLDETARILRISATESGAFEKAFGNMTKTMEFRIAGIKVAWQNFLLSIGTAMWEPVMQFFTDLAKKINNTVTWFKSLDNATQQSYLKWVMYIAIIGPLATVLGNLIRVFGGLFTAMTVVYKFLVTSLFPALVRLFTMLGWTTAAVIAAAPWIALGIAIVGVGYAVHQLSNADEEFIRRQTEVNELIKESQKLREGSFQADTPLVDSLPYYKYSDVSDESDESLNNYKKELSDRLALQDEMLKKLTALQEKQYQEEKGMVRRYIEWNLSMWKTYWDGMVRIAKTIVSPFIAIYENIVNSVKYLLGDSLAFQKETNSNKLQDEIDTVNKIRDINKSHTVEIQKELDLRAAMGQENIDPVDLTSIDLEQLKLDTKVQDEYTKKIQDIWNNYATGMLKIDNLLKTFNASKNGAINLPGIQVNKTEDTLKLMSTAIEALGSTAEVNTPKFKNFVKEYMALQSQRLTLNLTPMVNRAQTQPQKLLENSPVKKPDTIEFMAELAKTTRDYNDAVKLANISAQIFGQSFDLNSALIKINDEALKQLVKELADTEGNMIAVAEVQKKIDAALDTRNLLAANQIMETYNSTLKKNAEQFTKRGSSQQLYIANLIAEKTKLESLKKTLDVTSEAYARLADQLINVNKRLEASEGIKKFNTTFQRFGDMAKDFLSTYVDLLNNQQTKALKMVETTAKATGKSAEWIAKKQEQINDEYNKKKKKAAIATAIIDGALAVSNLLATTPGGVLNPLFWISAGLTAALTAAKIGVISGAAMAEGGIVPAGYNNDTYPARLTSGEMVIPPGKLDSVMGKGNKNITINGRLIAEGRDLVYVFEEMGKLNNNF